MGSNTRAIIAQELSRVNLDTSGTDFNFRNVDDVNCAQLLSALAANNIETAPGAPHLLPDCVYPPERPYTTSGNPAPSRRRHYFGTSIRPVTRAKFLFERRPSIEIKTDVSPA